MLFRRNFEYNIGYRLMKVHLNTGLLHHPNAFAFDDEDSSNRNECHFLSGHSAKKSMKWKQKSDDIELGTFLSTYFCILETFSLTSNSSFVEKMHKIKLFALFESKSVTSGLRVTSKASLSLTRLVHEYTI